MSTLSIIGQIVGGVERFDADTLGRLRLEGVGPLAGGRLHRLGPAPPVAARRTRPAKV